MVRKNGLASGAHTRSLEEAVSHLGGGRTLSEGIVRLARRSEVCDLLPCYLGEFYSIRAVSGVCPRPTVTDPIHAPFWLPDSRLPATWSTHTRLSNDGLVGEVVQG